MFRRLLPIVGIGLIACVGGLAVQPVAVSVARPSQVAMYVAVSDDKEPLTDLSATNFTLYEDGERLDPAQAKLTLLDRDKAAVHRALLLVDTGGLNDQVKLGKAVAGLVRIIRRHQAVDVYAFAGSDKIQKLGSFARDPNASDPDAIEELSGTDRDASRNLNGAIVQGLDQLDADLTRGDRPVRFGTLVVVTGGADLAGRVAQQELDERLRATHNAVIAVGVGDKTPAALERIGRDGYYKAPTLDGLSQTLDQVAKRVDGLYQSRYLVAYCSPSRAGERKLRVEVTVTKAGDGGSSGGTKDTTSFETRFDATGFGPGCDPSATPPFLVTLVAGKFGWLPSAASDGGGAEPEPVSAPSDGGVEGGGEAEEDESPSKPAPRAPPPRAPRAPAPAPKAPPPAPAPKPPPAAPKPPPAEEPPPGEFEP
jgi:hypothetical protein